MALEDIRSFLDQIEAARIDCEAHSDTAVVLADLDVGVRLAVADGVRMLLVRAHPLRVAVDVRALGCKK